jgi:hypothetical protein
MSVTSGFHVTLLSHDDTVEVRYVIRYERYALVSTAASLVGGGLLGINFGPPQPPAHESGHRPA